jgi:hypothetical protein
LVIPKGGGKPVAYQRCTTFIDVLSDRHNLENWLQRQVALGLARRPDLLLKVSSVVDDKGALDEVCEAAKEAAGSSMKATIGTALHALTEQVDRGQKPVIPPSHADDIFAYIGATAHLVKQDIEVFVVNDELEVAGTFDRVVIDAGKPTIADLKTGNIDYDAAKITMQLAVYANSQRYDPKTGARSPLGADRTRGLVIHMPAGEGKCEIYETDLVQGMIGVKLAAEVRAWRKKKIGLDPTRGNR